jgi:hypothetical protein
VSAVPLHCQAAFNLGDDPCAILSVPRPVFQTTVAILRVLPVDFLGAARSVRLEHGPVLVGLTKAAVRVTAVLEGPPGNRTVRQTQIGRLSSNTVGWCAYDALARMAFDRSDVFDPLDGADADATVDAIVAKKRLVRFMDKGRRRCELGLVRRLVKA